MQSQEALCALTIKDGAPMHVAERQLRKQGKRVLRFAVLVVAVFGVVFSELVAGQTQYPARPTARQVLAWIQELGAKGTLQKVLYPHNDRFDHGDRQIA